MGKKRRTRADKIRAAQRRKQRRKPAETARKDTQTTIAAVERPPQRAKQQQTERSLLFTNLRPSLLLFVAVVVFQLGLLLTFSFTGIDESLFEIFKT